MPIDNRNRDLSGDGTLESILKGKAIVQQRLSGETNPDFFTKSLTDDDYIRIGQAGTKDIEKRTIAGTAKDVLISGAKGVVGLGEAVVGLADIPTGGRVGKAMEDYLGYDSGATQKFLSDFYSDAQKASFSEVEKAQGFFDTAKGMLKHPSTIVHALVESGPQMLGSAAMARKLMATGILKASPAWRGILAAAIGEGAVSAGSTAEGIRTQTEDGLLTAKQSLISVASGFGTGAFAVAGGRVASKLGIGDIDVFLGGGSTASSRGIIKRIIGGGITEGAFEELPQSMQEQVWLNAAMDKPLLDGVAEAGAAGLITGAVMGGGFGAMQGRIEPKKKETAKDVLLDETPEEKDVRAKDILTREPTPIEPEGAESLAAEEAAAGVTEEALKAAIPEEVAVVEEAAIPEKVAAPEWIETLPDAELSKREETLRKVEKEIGLSDKQKKNLGMIRQEQTDRGIMPVEPKEVLRDRKEEERLARAERERKEPGRPVPEPKPSAEEIEAGRILEKKKADEAKRIKTATPTETDAKAQEAATSPLSDAPQPTEAQIEAGTYKKGHIKVQGLDISVENPDKSQRTGTDPDGKKWSVTMHGHYGYFKRSEGKDGEQIDVFVNAGERRDTDSAFIVDQVDPKTGKFDEHKVMMGYKSVEAAREGYLANYEKGWKGLGEITEVSATGLKEFIEKKQTKPYADKAKEIPVDIVEFAKEHIDEKGNWRMQGDTLTKYLSEKHTDEIISLIQWANQQSPHVKRNVSSNAADILRDRGVPVDEIKWQVEKMGIKAKIPAEFVGMQEKIGEASFPIVTELDDVKSTVTYDPEKHDITIKKAEYEKAIKSPKTTKVPEAVSIPEEVSEISKGDLGLLRYNVRNEWNEGDVESWRKKIREGEKVEPVEVILGDKGDIYIIDGHHRARAAQLEGKKIPFIESTEDAATGVGMAEWEGLAEKPAEAEKPVAKAEPSLKKEPEKLPAHQKAIPEFEGIDLSKITVKVSAISEVTGEKIQVEEKADVAMAEIDKEAEKYYELLACL